MRAKKVYENIEFERGKDPQQALGIGRFRDGYRIDKEADFYVPPPTDDGYVRIDFKGDEWNWSKKAFDPNYVNKTKVDSRMAKKLKALPVVTFRTYWENKGETGLFGDWSRETFPFRLSPFIAQTIEDPGRRFLVDPEGYEYPRYITELV